MRRRLICVLEYQCKITLKDHGQVAQLVEHGPEKAGVGGSSPPLTTLFCWSTVSSSLEVVGRHHFDISLEGLGDNAHRLRTRMSIFVDLPAKNDEIPLISCGLRSVSRTISSKLKSRGPQANKNASAVAHQAAISTARDYSLCRHASK